MKTPKSIYKSLECRVKSAIYARKDFRTSRHIVVFESDDWGSIRMSNKAAWNALLQKGYAVDKRPYERFDTLESSEDLEALFEVLMRYRDSQGNHPVITANMLMANPDFDKIKASNYSEYFYEPIEEIYKRYYGNTKVLDLMRQGLEEGVFMPQSHGREHFNVHDWLNALQNEDEDTLVAFQYGMCGIAPKLHPEHGNKMMVALRANNDEQQTYIEKSVEQGLEMFEALWGFKSKTFVAPCYVWNSGVEKVLAQKGIQLIQCSRSSKATYQCKEKFYTVGKQNAFGQIYSIRNCTFEPATISSDNNVDKLMKQVGNCFKQHKIAVFSTHRINYVGGLSEQNKKNTLSKLDLLLDSLLKNYPDVVFMSSNQLLSVLK